MADKEQVIVEVVYDTNQAQKNVDALTTDIVGLEQANKDLKAQLKAGAISQEDYSKAVESNRTTLAKNKAERKDNIKYLQAEEKSQDSLQKQVKLLTNERKKLNLESKEGQEQAKKLNAQIDELRGTINENSSALEQNKNNIGNYKDSITEALGETDLFGGAMDKLGSAGDGAAGGLMNMAKGIGSATKAALRFILTPIGAIIAALVVVVKLLSEAISRNEGIMDTFTEAFAGISNIIETVIGRIQRLVNIAAKLMKGQISLSEAIDEGKGAFKGMGEEMKNAYTEGVALAKMQKELEETTIRNTKELARLNAEFEKQSAIADDATLSFTKQKEALKLATKASEEAAKIEVKASEQILKEINKRVEIAKRNGAISRELRKEQAEGMAAVIEAQSRLTLVTFDNAKRRREIRQDEFEQELDFVLDIADKRKTENEKTIADETKMFEVRQEILEETQAFMEESFEQQIQLFEENFQIQIDTNELLRLNNREAAEYAFGLGLSEIATNRLLEVIRERISMTADLETAEEEFNAAREKFFKEDNARRDSELDAELAAIETETNAQLEAANAVFDNNLANTEALTQAEREAAIQRAQIATELGLTVIGTFQNVLDYRIHSLEQQKQKELDNDELTEEEKVKIRKKYGKQQQKIQITQAIISGSLAVLNALQTVPFVPLGVAAGIAAGVSTGLQISAIKNQTFADGGLAKTGTFGGSSHAAGGTRGVFSDGTRIEVERDENFYVLKKDASDRINALSSINESFGGRAFGNGRVRHAAKGGQMATGTQAAESISMNDIREEIQRTPIEVKVTSITAGIAAEENATQAAVV